MFAKFNLKIQTLMIDVTNSSITKLFDVSSINNNVLSLINITTTIILIILNANDTAMTTLLIILKYKSIKLKIMRVYKS